MDLVRRSKQLCLSILPISSIRGVQVNLQPLKTFEIYGSAIYTPTALFPEKGHQCPLGWRLGSCQSCSVQGCTEKHFDMVVGI
jgi:hypothetical protein